MFRFIDSHPLLKAIDGQSEFVAVDVETTGLDDRTDRITEIGAVRFRLTGSLAEFVTLVDPLRPIAPDASRVSGITDDMVRGQPRMEEVIDRFLEFAGQAPLVAHNARFDGGFLRAALRAAGRPLIANPIIDTRRLAKTLWPAWRKYSLGLVLDFLCLPHEQLHRALSDAKACRDVFLACLGKAAQSRSGLRRAQKKIAFVLSEDDVDETV